MADEPKRSGAILRLVAAGTQQSAPLPNPSSRDVAWSILMARAQGGDGAAYERLLIEITPYLRALAGRRCRTPHDVEDTVQEILVTVHTIRATYDPSRPFAPWLVAIANRRIVDHLRRRIRSDVREEPIGPEHESFPDHCASHEDGIERRNLEAAVTRLPPGQQQAVRMLKLQELSLKEASATSGLSIAALKVATHRALKSLREAMSKGRDS